MHQHTHLFFPARRASIILAAALATTLLAGCGEEPQLQQPDSVIRPVLTAPVKAVSLDSKLRFFGEVQSANRAELGFRTGGRMIEIMVDEGDEVSQGQLLARLDPADAELTLSRAEIELQSSQREYRRAEQLFERNKTIPKAQFDEAASALSMAENRVQEARRQLEHTQLLAPFDGIIARRLADNHALLQAEEPVLTLHDLNNLEVVIQVPARTMQWQGSSGKSFATLRNLPGQVFDLSLSRYATDPDPVTRTYAITLRFDDIRGEPVLPGMSVEVTPNEQDDSLAQSLTVPVSAVQPDNMGSQFIWVVNSEGVLEKRRVEVGGINADHVVIKRNVAFGEQVVVAGLTGLSEGQQVRVQPVNQQEGNR